MQRGPHARSSCRRCPRLQRSPAISTRSAAHFLKSYQLLVQNFAADRNRQKGASPPHRPSNVFSKVAMKVRACDLASAAAVAIDDTVETKKAAQRFTGSNG